MCQLFTYLYFWESFCLQVLIWEKVANFGNLDEMLLGKSLSCTSKLCNRLPAWLCLRREIKGLFLKFWWEACLKLWFFSPEISEKGYFWHQLSLEIHKCCLNSRGTSLCLCESVESFVKISFCSLDRPHFWNRGQSIDFCDLVFERDVEQGLYRGPSTFKWHDIAIICIFS